MASFVSARFEKDDLPITDQVRIIVRNLDQGSVPPQPSVAYFPTHPDTLRPFIVAEFVSRVIGENFVRVATLTDLDTLNNLSLNVFEDTTVNFTTAGVTASDQVEITLPNPEIWTSEEYPGTNPFTFTVSVVLSATQLEVALPFPVFNNTLSWAIPSRGLTGSAGTTIRRTNPIDSSTFIDKRFNRYFADALAATNFVTATKADLRSLANESIGAELIDENFTASPD
jgi:hypothetical protein